LTTNAGVPRAWIIQTARHAIDRIRRRLEHKLSFYTASTSSRIVEQADEIARADVLRRMGSSAEAARSYERALVVNDSGRRFLERRPREVQARLAGLPVPRCRQGNDPARIIAAR
jgi:predicted RNA polymerase sigma factor